MGRLLYSDFGQAPAADIKLECQLGLSLCNTRFSGVSGNEIWQNFSRANFLELAV